MAPRTDISASLFCGGRRTPSPLLLDTLGLHLQAFSPYTSLCLFKIIRQPRRFDRPVFETIPFAGRLKKCLRSQAHLRSRLISFAVNAVGRDGFHEDVLRHAVDFEKADNQLRGDTSSTVDRANFLVGSEHAPGDGLKVRVVARKIAPERSIFLRFCSCYCSCYCSWWGNPGGNVPPNVYFERNHTFDKRFWKVPYVVVKPL